MLKAHSHNVASPGRRAAGRQELFRPGPDAAPAVLERPTGNQGILGVAHVSTCNIHMYICIYIYTYVAYHIEMYVYMHVHVYIYIYVYIDMCIYIHVYTYTYEDMCVYI